MKQRVKPSRDDAPRRAESMPSRRTQRDVEELVGSHAGSGGELLHAFQQTDPARLISGIVAQEVKDFLGREQAERRPPGAPQETGRAG